MPSTGDLPEAISGLAKLVAISIRRRHRDEDLTTLCDKIEKAAVRPGAER